MSILMYHSTYCLLIAVSLVKDAGIRSEREKNTCPSWPSDEDEKRGEINGASYSTSQLLTEKLYCFLISIASSLYDSHTDRQS